MFNDLSGNRGFNPVYAFLIFFCFLCLFKIEEPVSHCVSGQSAVWCADHSHVPVFPAAGVDQPHYLQCEKTTQDCGVCFALDRISASPGTAQSVVAAPWVHHHNLPLIYVLPYFNT